MAMSDKRLDLNEKENTSEKIENENELMTNEQSEVRDNIMTNESETLEVKNTAFSKVVSTSELQELTEQAVNDVSNFKFRLVIPPADSILVSINDIQKALGNDKVSQALLDSSLTKEERDKIITEQIGLYTANYLGMNLSEAERILSQCGVENLMIKALRIYSSAKVDYETPFGTIKVLRKDIKLIKGVFKVIIACMIYITLFNFFTEFFIEHTVLYVVGMILYMINVYKTCKLLFRVAENILN